MRQLAALLLLVVFVTHYGYDHLAAFYANKAHAAAAWFYVLRGVQEVILYLLIAFLTPRRSGPAFVVVVAACIWGALEGAQAAVCQSVAGMGAYTSAPGPYAGLCDAVTGWPMYLAGLMVACLIAGQLARKE